MATVAVITPTYQHRRYIEAAIRSVLAQTFADWELIVVDDGSTDGTPDVAESFMDTRITVIRREHEGLVGLGRAYAEALARSAAPLVAVLEGDDTWPITKLEVQVPAFDDPQVVLSYGPAELIDDRGCVYATYWRVPKGPTPRNDPVGAVIPALASGNFIVSPTVMIRRRALDAIGGFIQPDGVPYVDHPTWLKLATIGSFGVSHAVVGQWRRHADQYTTLGLTEPAPSGAAYLAAMLAAAKPLLAPDEWHALQASVAVDAERQLVRATVGRGRLALLGGRWAPAARIWRGVLRTGSPGVRVVALLGLISVAMRTDIEWLFRLTGRLSWPSRRHLATHRRMGKSPAR